MFMIEIIELQEIQKMIDLDKDSFYAEVRMELVLTHH